MTDPERIIEGHCGELATALMRSVRGDAPPPYARAATLAAVGIGAAAVPATTSAAAATGTTVGITALGLIKSLAIGVGTAALVIGVAHQISKPARPPTAPREPVGAVNIVHPAQPLAPTPPAAVAAEPEVVARASDKATPARVLREPAAAPARAESTLVAEIAALDRARSTARNHDPAAALALLDAYQRDFPNGVLAVEAGVLRIEALADSGQTDRALALGRALLRASPSGPHAERIRSIVAGIEAARGEGNNE